MEFTNGKGNGIYQWEGKFEAAIPGNGGKWKFPLTPALEGTRTVRGPICHIEIKKKIGSQTVSGPKFSKTISDISINRQTSISDGVFHS